MGTMNVSLPQQMTDWVEAQTNDGKYANTLDFVRDLICKEQIKQEKMAALQEKIDEGFQSGFLEVGNISALFDGLKNQGGL